MLPIKSMFKVAFLMNLTVASAMAQTSGGKDVKQVKAPRASIEKMKELSPEFAKLTDEVLFNDIWNRPGLSARDKSLVTISVLAALGRSDQLESHIKLGIENGLTGKEIQSAMTHIAFYAGWPAAVVGLQRLKNVNDQKDKK